MIYSVFDWNKRGIYHYFEGPGEGFGTRPVPVKLLNDEGGRGHRPEDVLPRVPAGSQKVGEGTEPLGRIAVLDAKARGLSFGEDEAPTATAPSPGSPSPAPAPATATAPSPGSPSPGSPSPSGTTSPWVVVGLWAGAVWLAYRVAFSIGRSIADAK